MASSLEQNLSRSLRAILADLPDGARIPDSEQFREVTSGLEYLLPEVLREIHPEWRHESLDGILPLVARKTREDEAEIVGMCILITDQTVTPLYLHLQIDPAADEVSWLECRLGERGKHGMMRTPYNQMSGKRFYALEGNADLIEWVYKVTFGERRSTGQTARPSRLPLAHDHRCNGRMSALLQQVISEMLARNRSYFGAGGPGYYGVEVDNLSPDGSEFDLTLTFKAGVRYCCIEHGCHIPLHNGWLKKVRERLRATGIEDVPPITHRKLHVVVEQGAIVDDLNHNPCSHESRQEYDEGPFHEG